MDRPAPDDDSDRKQVLSRTVAEMRRLLGFLRSEDEASSPGPPPPTLGRVDDLVGEMRRAGLRIDLGVEGELDDLPPGRALAAFRILQRRSPTF